MLIALLYQGLFHKSGRLNIQTRNTASETGLLTHMSQISSSLNEELSEGELLVTTIARGAGLSGDNDVCLSLYSSFHKLLNKVSILR